MIHTSAPGKLFLSGEWSILEVGNLGIVAAVDKRVHAVVEDFGESYIYPKISITIDDFNIKDISAKFDGKQLVFSDISDYEKEKLQFIKEGIEVALQFLQKRTELKNFKIRTWGEMSQIFVGNDAKKIGFGSSAAACVATIAAILAYHRFHIRKEEVYKLSTIAHYFAQGKVGSAFDIAASTYGGIFVYSRFDPNWLIDELKEKSIADVIEEKWPSFHVEELKIPDDFVLSVAWTRESASTSAMIKQMNQFKEFNPNEYNALMNEINELVSQLITAWKNKDRNQILDLLRKNEELLRELGKKSDVNIETNELRMLSDIANQFNAAGKLSGAGGGDCGIAICFDSDTAERIKSAWQEAGLYPLDVGIDREGVKIVR